MALLSSKGESLALGRAQKPLRTLPLPLPHSSPGFSASGLPTSCGRCHVCLRLGCPSVGRPLKCAPCPICIHQHENTGDTLQAPALREHPCLRRRHPGEKEGRCWSPASVPGLKSGGQGGSSCTTGGQKPYRGQVHPQPIISVASLPRTWALLLPSRQQTVSQGHDTQGPRAPRPVGEEGDGEEDGRGAGPSPLAAACTTLGATEPFSS